jgi:xylulose-5-phosphate/fructose-6-phosphate phosphoketolase
MDVIDRVPSLGASAADVRAEMVARREEARAYTRTVGDDIPSVRDWSWPY